VERRYVPSETGLATESTRRRRFRPKSGDAGVDELEHHVVVDRGLRAAVEQERGSQGDVGEPLQDVPDAGDRECREHHESDRERVGHPHRRELVEFDSNHERQRGDGEVRDRVDYEPVAGERVPE